tara:strand:- start:11164 stop:11568 length:405 start_codon:yes stop_codon:yes gene_type:complete
MIPVDSMKSFRKKSICEKHGKYDTIQDSLNNDLNMEEDSVVSLQQQLKQHLYESNNNKPIKTPISKRNRMQLSNATPMHYWIRDLEIEAHKKSLNGEGRLPHSPIIQRTCTQKLCNNIRNNEKCGCAYFFNMGR